MPYRSSAPTPGQVRPTAPARPHGRPARRRAGARPARGPAAPPTPRRRAAPPRARTRPPAPARALVARGAVAMRGDIPTAGRQPGAAVVVAGTAAGAGR